MQVVLVEPCTPARVYESDGSLENMQDIVGGYIETVPLEEFPNLVVVCNEEGKILGLEANFENYSDIIVGTVLVCKTDGENFIGLNDKECDQVIELMNSTDDRW